MSTATGATHVDGTHDSAFPSKTVGVRVAETTPTHMHRPSENDLPSGAPCSQQAESPDTTSCPSRQARDPPPGAWTQRCPTSPESPQIAGITLERERIHEGQAVVTEGFFHTWREHSVFLMCIGPSVQTKSPETSAPHPLQFWPERWTGSEQTHLTAPFPLPRQEMEHPRSTAIFLNPRFLP